MTSTLFCIPGANLHKCVTSTALPGLTISAFGLLVGFGCYYERDLYLDNNQGFKDR